MKGRRAMDTSRESHGGARRRLFSLSRRMPAAEPTMYHAPKGGGPLDLPRGGRVDRYALGRMHHATTNRMSRRG